MRREYWILLLITIFGLFLRLTSLIIGFALQGNLDISLFPDEANFLLGARYFYYGSFPPTFLYYHNSLILSPLIAALYSFFGVSAFAGRFISVLLGTLTIPLTYLLGKELFKNEKKALLSAFLLSISFIHRFWTIRALADGPLTFFFILSIYFFIRGIHSEEWHWYIWAGIATTITVLVKYPGILIYLIIFSFLIINIYLKQISKKALLYYLLTLVIFAFVAVTLLLSQFALALQPLNQISYFLKVLFSGSTNPFYYIFYSFFLNIFWALLLSIVLGIILIYSIKKHSKGDILLLSWIAIVFIFFSFYGESELYRYLLPAFPAFYLLISHFFIEHFRKFRFSVHRFKFSKNSLVALSLVLLLAGFITTELFIGESLIVKRSTTYGGIYRMSTWFNINSTQGTKIMAPSNSLAQLEFYTNSNFQYFALTTRDTEIAIYNYIQTLNISYIILSEHFPETLSLPIYQYINNTSYYTLNFSYSDGTFETSLYLVK
ncbi:MAG: glycosyltransferase family 39 protein [Candidatus Helarchaeota archaeon]|nr:glycosyltransferase family 39 protein [Candidatus Helarchaeota archaeon]